MSERTIKFIYKDEEKIENIFANFEECKKAFQKEFDLSDIEMNKISLYYKDDEDENTLIDSNEDYNFFLDSNSSCIECQEVWSRKTLTNEKCNNFPEKDKWIN